MGEVAEMFDVRHSLIRYWGEQFDALKPKRNKKGNRMFSPEDVETLKLIYHLVKERGMTIDGARRALKARRHAGESSSRDVELLDRLQRLRAMLSEVRAQLGDEEGITIAENDYTADGTESSATAAAADAEPAAAPAAAGSADDAPAQQPAKEERPLPFYEQTLF